MKNTIMMKYVMIFLVITSFVSTQGASEPTDKPRGIFGAAIDGISAGGSIGMLVALVKDFRGHYSLEPYGPYRFTPLHRCIVKGAAVGLIGTVGLEALAMCRNQKERDNVRS